LAAPEYIVDQLALIKQREILFTDGVGQYALAHFLQSGLFDEHLVRLRTEHARRRRAFQNALKRHLPARLLKFEIPSGGLYFWCHVDAGLNSWQWSQQALAAGVAFTSGDIFYADAVSSQQARFCYTWLTPEKIEAGIKLLAETVKAGARPSGKECADIPLV
jgi:2-aminoadipate transaminase